MKSAAGLAALSSKTSDPLVHVEINKTKSTRKSCPKVKKTVDPVWESDNKFEFKGIKRNGIMRCVLVCLFACVHVFLCLLLAASLCFVMTLLLCLGCWHIDLQHTLVYILVAYAV